MKKHHTLGSVEQQIMKHLFYHPDEFIQRIKKAIGKDYKTVNLGVHRLETKGYLEVAEFKKTEKGREEKTYRLNQKGIAWALAYGRGDLTKMPPTYLEYELAKNMQTLSHAVGKKHLQKLIRRAFKLFLVLLEEEERGKQISSTEAVEYVLGAMSAWHVLHLDEKQFGISEQPKPMNKKDIMALISNYSKAKRKFKIK